MKKISLKGNKKTIIKIATVTVAILLVVFYAGLCYVTVNSINNAGRYSETAGTRFIAHRGYSERYFQNTVQAFDAAGKEIFFQGIETDVRMTKDGVFVCSHDDNPFADKSVLISEKSFEEIKDLPLDLSSASVNADLSYDYRIATLEEYLKVCSESRKTAFVEIKQKFSREETRALVSFVYSKISRSQAYFCGFDKKVIDYVHAEYSSANLMLFASNGLKAYLYGKMGYNVGVKYTAVKNKKPIERAHDKDCFLNAWTVNDSETAKRLMNMGIDYITTDCVLFGERAYHGSLRP